MSSTRQLAAIMFTDIVGYTALMGKDSNKALEIVRISKEIQKPLVEKHNGKWLKEMGDGAMAQFSTALDAVNCSIEIQESARAKLDAKLRIGIHLGDVTVEEDDVHGDGVNVASRLESIADPGGIYISESIEKAIQGQTDVQAKYLGEVKLKNVAYGVRTYALQGVGLPVPEVKEEKELSGHFFAELQRRGVLRAGLAYVVLSLLLILLSPYSGSVVDLPQWFNTALLIILLAGFPVALYLAWNYERSPEGFVRTSSEQSWQNPLATSQRKPLTSNFIIIGLLLVIIVVIIYPRLSLTEAGNREDTEATIDDKSIAVLHFENMSNDPEQEYFSNGITEDILNHLSKIEDLRVKSRTSTLQYKGSTKSIPEIGSELGVSYVLAGSVRKVGNQVRITAQLIEVESDHHLWSESYDRDLTDIFTIQTEIAKSVALELQATINPDTRTIIESVPTANMQAYDLFLQARQYLGSSNQSRILLEKSISLDSTFASAHALLADHWISRGTHLGDLTAQEVILKAFPLLNKALRLDDKNAYAHQSLAFLHLFYNWDFEASEKEWLEIMRINPSGPQLNGYIHLLIVTGRFSEARLRAGEIAEINPEIEDVNLALSLFFLDKQEEAIALLETSLGKGRPSVYLHLCRFYLDVGLPEKVIEIGEEYFLSDRRSPWQQALLAIAYKKVGKPEKAKSIVQELKKKSNISPVGSPSYCIALFYSAFGETNHAIEWLQKAFYDREVEMHWMKVEPLFESLHDDPRYQEMLDMVGFPD